MVDSVSIDAVGALLSLSDWDRRDGVLHGPYGMTITSADGAVVISFPDPHSRGTARLSVSGEWSMGTVADLATHVAMVVRMVATVRSAGEE